MSLFFDKNLIINELGVKGGATLEDDDTNTPTPDDNDTPTGDGPVDPPEDNDGPADDDDGPVDAPEDNDGPTDDNDGPTDPEDNDGPTDDDDGPTDPEDNDTPSDDSSTDGADTNELPDDTPSDDDSSDNDDTDDIDDGPIDDDDGSTDDGDMEDFDDTKQKTLSDLEDSIFSSLTPEQKAIKVVELKGSYVELFKACDDILEKINLIPKENSTIEVFENITNTLLDLKTYIEYYISRTYDTRSYLENEVTLQKYTTIFNAVKEMFKEISKRK